MKISIAVGVVCWIAGYLYGAQVAAESDDKMRNENTVVDPPRVEAEVEKVNISVGPLLYTVRPIDRKLAGIVHLRKNYSCMMFAADSMAWSKMRKGMYGYAQFATSILGSAGYTGEAVLQSSPGMGLLDLLSVPDKDYLQDIVMATTDRGCQGVVVQLGINDAFKHITPSSFLSIYRSFMLQLRVALPHVALVMPSITPCTEFPGGTGRWLHEVNLGISEVAVAVKGLFSDTHWGLLREMQRTKKQRWTGILDDHVHPTHHARYLMGRSIAGSVIARQEDYPATFTCGDSVHWMGYIMRPSWAPGKEWDCAHNPRIVLKLSNTTLSFTSLPIPLSLSPPWGSIFGRMPVFGTYTWHAAGADTYSGQFEYVLGGPSIWIPLRPQTTTFEIRLQNEYKNWKPPRRPQSPPPPPAPLRPVNPPRDYEDTLSYLKETAELH